MLVKQKKSIALYLIMQRGTPEQLKIEYSVTAQKILVSFQDEHMSAAGVPLTHADDGRDAQRKMSCKHDAHLAARFINES